MSTKPAANDVPFNADSQLKLELVHGAIQRPDKFAELFVNAAQTQNSIKEHIRKEIRDSLTLDPDSRTALKGIMKECFKEDWKTWIRSKGTLVGFAIWSIFLAALSAWFGKILGK